MKRTCLCLGAPVALATASGDYWYDYTYRVSNQTDTTISAVLRWYGRDSTVLIPQGANTIILVTDHGVEKRNGPYYNEVGRDLRDFSIRRGSQPSRRDYIRNESWTYSDGTYQAVVTPAEF